MSSLSRSGNIVQKLIFYILYSCNPGNSGSGPYLTLTDRIVYISVRILCHTYHADHLGPVTRPSSQELVKLISGAWLWWSPDKEAEYANKIPTALPCPELRPIMLASWPGAIMKIILGACSNQISKPCRINNRFYNYNITCRSMKNSKLN